MAWTVPGVRDLMLQRDALQQEAATLRREVAELKTSSGAQWGTPSYDADYMRVWFHNTDFLKDERFLRAYAEGANSNHGLGNSGEDLHIEWRILVCVWAAYHAAQLEGDFVECGTNTGIMSLAICNYLDWNSIGRRFFLFDTFEGIPVEQIAKDEAHAFTQNSSYRQVYEIAKANFAPYKNARLIRGKVPSTLKDVEIERVAYLMLDMNILFPEREALAFFWDKLVPGGIILFDDYGWSGYHLQKESHDAFAASKGAKILNLPTGQGMLLKI
jgi:O-methyltransferase